VGVQVFRVTKHPFSFMNAKKKPSETLGNIIRILVIIKLALAIIHLLI